MRTIERNVYKFHELPEPIRDKIVSTWRNDDFFHAGDDIRASIDEIALFCGVTFLNWTYDDNTYNYKLSYTCGDSDRSAYRVITDILYNIRHTKYGMKRYYTADYKKSRKSKITVDKDGCSFTGVCYDCYFWDAINELHKPENFFVWSFADFMTFLFDKFFQSAVNEYEYWLSAESIVEEIEANDYEFYGNGELI